MSWAHDTTTAKFPGEARGVFGCVLRRDADGELEVAPCMPYCYSGKNVISPEAFQKKINAELRRVEGKKWPWTAAIAKGGQWLGYQGRWPETLEEELRAAVEKLESDSPELCRGLDSNGFADLGTAVTLNCSLATYYPRGHAMRAKWNRGNVDALWNCMSETWMKFAPTSGRIAEDIMKIAPVLGKIIEAKGGVVPGEFYRTGRRWRHVDDKGDCARKPGVQQRKATLHLLLMYGVLVPTGSNS